MGIMVFVSHLLVYYGISVSNLPLTFLGRIIFGIFSAGLFSKIYYLIV